jgi:hypothetical protein
MANTAVVVFFWGLKSFRRFYRVGIEDAAKVQKELCGIISTIVRRLI